MSDVRDHRRYMRLPLCPPSSAQRADRRDERLGVLGRPGGVALRGIWREGLEGRCIERVASLWRLGVITKI